MINKIRTDRKGSKKLEIGNRLPKQILSEILPFLEISGLVPCHVVSFDGTIVDVNPGWEKMFGYKKNEVVRRKVWRLIHEDERANAKKRHHARTHGLKEPEREHSFRKYIAKNRQSIIVETSNIIATSKGETVAIVTVFLDVTKIKELEELASFAFMNIADKIRNPNSIVGGNIIRLQQLNEKGELTSKDLDEKLVTIAEASGKIEDVLKSVLQSKEARDVFKGKSLRYLLKQQNKLI